MGKVPANLKETFPVVKSQNCSKEKSPALSDKPPSLETIPFLGNSAQEARVPWRAWYI